MECTCAPHTQGLVSLDLAANITMVTCIQIRPTTLRVTREPWRPRRLLCLNLPSLTDNGPHCWVAACGDQVTVGMKRKWEERKDERKEGEWSGPLVIKTFHDIRICEVPWADHRDHSVKFIFLLFIVVQRGRTTARGVVVVYSDCLGNKRTQFSTRLWSKVTFHSHTLQKKSFLNQYFFLVLQ